VSVGPSAALFRAVLISADVVPAVQFHEVPLPLQLASASEAQSRLIRLNRTIPLLHIKSSL
jgi:hypothetical protein